ncbi:hypothetical protein [Actinoplanes palleronii]|uniref:hypothetical protein n=1 Tax=Actinoplanes palleronii TaxID=113570 RepID=UPI00194588D5|nr:hypothetical protein [Actinoplanes palleronii]
MMRSRIVPAVLLCAALAGLAACDDADTEAGSAPSAAPSAVASTGAASAPAATTGAASAPAGAAPANDKALCEMLNKTASTMKNTIANGQKADGHVEPADVQNAFAKFHKAVDEALLFATDSKVTSAARAVADEVSKAAADPDPIGTAADSGFEKLSTDLTTACQSVGVTINF